MILYKTNDIKRCTKCFAENDLACFSLFCIRTLLYTVTRIAYARFIIHSIRLRNTRTSYNMSDPVAYRNASHERFIQILSTFLFSRGIEKLIHKH